MNISAGAVSRFGINSQRCLRRSATLRDRRGLRRQQLLLRALRFLVRGLGE